MTTPRFLPVPFIPSAPFALFTLFAFLALSYPAAEPKPLSYASLSSQSRLVVEGVVKDEPGGQPGDERKAAIEVNGVFKGRLNRKEIEVSWKDSEFKETGYKPGSQVILFLRMREDSTFAQTASGLSCWPVEKVAIRGGKPLRAVPHAYPLNLLSGIPNGALRKTEGEAETIAKVHDSQAPKRKEWIVVDALLPPLKPLKLGPPNRPHRSR